MTGSAQKRPNKAKRDQKESKVIRMIMFLLGHTKLIYSLADSTDPDFSDFEIIIIFS